MRCIFCKSETNDAEPVEHILPESLGNEKHLLRRGVVCGKCNNYFAGKVEKPFLEQSSINALRFHQAVPSKKGRIPMMKGIMQPGNIIVELMRDSEDGQLSVVVPTEKVKQIQAQEEGRLYIIDSSVPKSNPVNSRFLAKVALEALAHRVQDNDEWLVEIVDKEELDLIRGHARWGNTIDWPIATRKIYDASALWADAKNENYQLVNEFDFLFSDLNEVYFVLAIFGYQMVINMGGPDLDGWYAWLKENDNASPLHHGKNANVQIQVEKNS